MEDFILCRQNSGEASGRIVFEELPTTSKGTGGRPSKAFVDCGERDKVRNLLESRSVDELSNAVQMAKRASGLSTEAAIVNQPRKAAGKHRKDTVQMAIELLENVNNLIIERLEVTEDSRNDRKSKTLYRITNEDKTQIFSATMENVFCTRIGFGRMHNEQFNVMQLHPTDNKYDVMHLFRTLSCDACCLPCSLQMLEIYCPVRCLRGSITQKCNLLNAVFEIRNIINNQVIATIVGQNFKLDAYKILNLTNREIGSIQHKTLAVSAENSGTEFNTMEAFVIYFDDMCMDLKLLVLGATFLIDNIYFESPKCFRRAE